MNLFFDIETVPDGYKIGKKDVVVPGQYKKEESKQQWLKDNAEEAIEKEYRSRSLDSLKGRVLCLGYALDYKKPKVLIGTEEEIIDRFEGVLNEVGSRELMSLTYIGFNIYEFDIPWLYQRAVKYNKKIIRDNIPLSKYEKRQVVAGVYEGRSIDLMLWFNATRSPSKSYVSQRAVCEYLGIPTKENMDGSQVYDYMLQGKLDEIHEYCIEDVKTLQLLHKKMIG
ncbi:MAG: hypothetical protein ACOC4J_00390 [Bacteroidota bacterium]